MLAVLGAAVAATCGGGGGGSGGSAGDGDAACDRRWHPLPEQRATDLSRDPHLTLIVENQVKQAPAGVGINDNTRLFWLYILTTAAA